MDPAQIHSPETETLGACHQEQRRIVIDVMDLGSGIANDRRELVFSPFFTTKKEGTGLGIPIVKKIAEAHARVPGNPGQPGAGSHFQADSVFFTQVSQA
jgi:nitrogen fixation/metabolism regulation signal transduction histidine kinase